MPTQTTPSHRTTDQSGLDRRSPQNQRLRALIDEMMVTLRAAASAEQWTPATHTRFERDLDHVLSRLRREAVARTRPADADGAQGY